MRAVPDTLDPEIVAAIDRRLAPVCEEHGVTIPLAVESGSRAWGFPSPDSDYDARFLFLRPVDDYLRLTPLRDVVETPLDAVFDVNGWDVRKALGLLVRGNATVTEWLRSPIVYGGDAAFADGALELAERVLDRERVIDHYLHVGRRHAAHPGGKLKRFFYALRPAATLRWLRVHPGLAVAPMDLPTLMAENGSPVDVREAVAELIALKAATRELGAGEPPPLLRTFIEDEFNAAAHRQAGPRSDLAAGARLADEFFRELVLPRISGR
ncbi:nucleotidyltransferase domain-containing protein [Leifsonia shinshuensis]|uniref:nucleotidyltransferase domain-containing protein n=1 Tax=Leifsonia shinshuensis TaxID=150026 RepID=UPI001F50C5BE|nr:nucleotidyltransferase domain-containing protein [Leifsonia shinshuensis]MCI0156032.1 nucleotidyltransferase domain-containing protein [Leifsonia shinshuensis]